ncbi:hypothetical protein HOLleu_00136 [Holothuria leucospilota]|uniref:Uncharacterized protein n=1 Tax=Holothuria leucospilota TaxID=206669 RepID=A0A9Q1CMA7_HOLLE|nr:hypothetical protein HOLleu_00136 [Holothuria leucospilota]
MSAPNPKFFRNMSAAEDRALRELQGNPNIVIKQADKGSCVVVMDRERYVNEAYRHLSYPQVYQKLSNDPTPLFIREIRSVLDTLLK